MKQPQLVIFVLSLNVSAAAVCVYMHPRVIEIY